ncbi:MAG: metal-dependent transcriptional regulator [Alphaproteobacteria bacterium]
MLSKKITTSQEDYLEAILELSQISYNVHSKDIADILGVHRSTVTASLKSLSKKNLINYRPYEAVTLTAAGEKLAQKVTKRHKILCHFLINVLGLNYEDADNFACKIEHSVSEEIISKLVFLTDFLEKCPSCDADLIANFKDFCVEKEKNNEHNA